MNALKIKIASLNTEMLVEVVKGLSNTFKENSDLVFDLALNELEQRMDEKSFIDLCNSI